MTKLRLSPEEGFVLSRIVGPLTLRELVAISGLEEDKVVAMVRRLGEAGAVDIDEDDSFAEPERDPVPSFAGIDELDGLPDDDESGPVLETLEADDVVDEAPDLTIDVDAAALTDVGKVRTNNEDNFIVVDRAPKGTLLVVADGMGGENAGEVASAMVVMTLREHFADGATSDPGAQIEAAFQAANAKVVTAANEPDKEGMGSTVVGMLVSGGVVYTAEVGDSRGYVFRRGKLTQVTKDQTYTGLLIERGVLTPEAAKSSKAKNVILQACGKAPDLVVAQRKIELRHGDILLLCSDGLTGQVTDAEVEAVLGDGSGSLEEACKTLVAKANAAGGIDNVTVVLARVTGDLPDAGDADTVDSTLTVIRGFSPGE